MIAATREQSRRVARLQRLLVLATRREERLVRETAEPKDGREPRRQPFGTGRKRSRRPPETPAA